jgi:hypothetical protein
MKALPITFSGRGEVKGFLFTQISVTDRGFLYEVDTSGGRHYEVFKKRENHRFGCISYPTSHAFGIWAWTFSDINKAIIKLKELNHE